MTARKKLERAGDPSRAVERKSAAGDDAMDVGMVRQRLPPGVQDGEAADPRAEPARIGGQRRHGLSGGPEQDRIDGGLVLEGDRARSARAA